MIPKMNTLKSLLQDFISNIDAGNSNLTEEEMEQVIDCISKFNKGIKRISKAEACEQILHCSRSAFDKYIAMGIIPKGKKTYGFKELSWSVKDFDEALKYKGNKKD